MATTLIRRDSIQHPTIKIIKTIQGMGDSVVHAVSGASGGILSMLLTYPLITLSTRSQVSREGRISLKKALLQILKTEGVKGLYSGITSALVGIGFTQFTYYYWYEWVKSRFIAQKGALSVIDNIITGAIAGAATATLSNPIWVINTRMLVKQESEERDSSLQAARQIYKEEGLKGFFRGLLPSLFLVLNPIIQYTLYERLRLWLAVQRQATSKILTGLDFFLLGAISKLCATSMTYPYIVLKSRMQLQASKDAANQYTSISDGVRKIIKHEGVKGLFKGIESKLMQSVLSSAFTFAFKEEFYRLAVWMLE